MRKNLWSSCYDCFVEYNISCAIYLKLSEAGRDTEAPKLSEI